MSWGTLYYSILLTHNNCIFYAFGNHCPPSLLLFQTGFISLPTLMPTNELTQISCICMDPMSSLNIHTYNPACTYWCRVDAFSSSPLLSQYLKFFSHIHPTNTLFNSTKHSFLRIILYILIIVPSQQHPILFQQPFSAWWEFNHITIVHQLQVQYLHLKQILSKCINLLAQNNTVKPQSIIFQGSAGTEHKCEKITVGRKHSKVSATWENKK